MASSQTNFLETSSNVPSTNAKQDEPKPNTIKCSFSIPNLANQPSRTTILDLPEELVSNAEIFYDVLSKKTWDHCLSDDQKNRVLKFLPANVSSSQDAVERFLETFFNPTSKSTSFFTHPLVDFHEKLAGGYYDAACANEVRQLKACSRLHYEHRIREHYGRVLKKILVYRRKLLESAASVPEGEPFSYDWKTEYFNSLHRRGVLGRGGQDSSESQSWRRAMKRSRLMILDCKARANEPQVLSSDDEDLVPPGADAAGKGGPNGHQGASTGSSSHGSGHTRSSSTFDGARSRSSVRSTLAKLGQVDLDLHEPFGSCDIKDMVREYRRLRRLHSEHPSLEFDDIELDDVVDRCGHEIRFTAQKYGVYTKQLPNPDPALLSPSSSVPGASGSRKVAGGKQQSKAPASKEK